MKNNKAASLFPRELVIESLKQSFVKLNPKTMFRNPIMFIVEVVTFVMLFVTTLRRAITRRVRSDTICWFSLCCLSPCSLPILPRQ